MPRRFRHKILAPVGSVWKVLLLLAPFAVVIVALVNQLQASRVVSVLLVFALAAAGVALGAIFGPGTGSSSSHHDSHRGSPRR